VKPRASAVLYRERAESLQLRLTERALGLICLVHQGYIRDAVSLCGIKACPSLPLAQSASPRPLSVSSGEQLLVRAPSCEASANLDPEA